MPKQIHKPFLAVLLLALGLALCSCGNDGPGTYKKPKYPKAKTAADYPFLLNDAKAPLREDLLAEMKEYPPEIPQVEEEFWMTPELKELAGGRTFYYARPLLWYNYCLREAAKGNARAIACVGLMAAYTGPEQQKSVLSHPVKFPEDAHYIEYWMEKADAYMAPGYTYCRQGEAMGGGR